MSYIPRGYCKTCGHPLNGSRHGVYLPPAKLRLFDLIVKAPGLDQLAIAARLYPHATPEQAVKTVRTHINQLNNLFASTNVRISGSKSGKELQGYSVHAE